MTEYGINVLITVALVSLGMLLCYREGDKTLRLSLSLVLMSAVLLPLSSIISRIDFELPEDAEQTVVYEDGEFAKSLESAFCDGVELMIAEKFSLDGESIHIDIEGFDFKSLGCERMTVTLSGRAAFADRASIKKYTEENIKGCVVKVEVG